MVNADLVKGFKDYSGEEAIKRAKIKRIVEDLFTVYGFEPSETPVIEYEEFVKGDDAQDDAVSDIFKLRDRGKRKLALRYEFTFQLKRLMQNKKLPYKRYQIGPIFRDEPVTGNRTRQFIQCDIDVIGSKVKDEAEVLSVVSEILKKLGIKAVIYINNRRLLNEILKDNGIKDRNEVIKELDKLDKLSESDVKKNLKKYGAEKLIGIFKKDEKYFEKYGSYSEIKELRRACRDYGVKFVFSPYLARGFSYYTGTIFEVKSKGMNESLFGGGAYEFNGVNGFGFGVSLMRLSLVSKIEVSDSGVLIISLNQDKKAIEITSGLRDGGVVTQIYYGRPGKALDYANSKGIGTVIFVGGVEVKSGKYKIKDMVSGKEKSFSERDLIKNLIG